MFDSLFSPNSIAVIGASETRGKIGYDLLVNLIEGGFPGKIIPVNPSGGTILGLDVCSNLREYENNIELAIIAVPKNSVLDGVNDALSKGATAIIIVTAGFKETGNHSATLEEEISSRVRRGGARLLGPNCLGVINTCSSLNASFPGKPSITDT